MARAAPGVPITVKCRIGVDDLDSYAYLCEFIRVVAEGSPVSHFIIHSRKALLKGLSPAENRTIPPLKYEYVLALMRDFPHLHFSINGGIVTLPQAAAALSYGVHGVMIGRAAYNTPWQILAPADCFIFGAQENPVTNRRQLLEQYAAYADASLGMFGPGRPNVQSLVKPLLGLFHGEKGGARFRRAVDACVRNAKTPSAVIRAAMAVVPDDVLDAGPPTPSEELEHLPLGPMPEAPSSTLPPMQAELGEVVGASEGATVAA